MSTNRAPAAGVFGPYAPEQLLDRGKVDVVHCTRCRAEGRTTAVVFGSDAIGRTTSRCPVCDGVRKPRRASPDEVLKPQALIAPAQLLPACPPGKLRCQSCAHPVEGDERLCEKCSLPGLSKADRARAHREREDREAANAPARPKLQLPRALYPHGQMLLGDTPPRAPAALNALPKAVARAEREKKRPVQKAPTPAPVHSPHPSHLPDDDPRKIAWRAKMAAVRAATVFQRRLCAWVGCGATFQPTGPAAKYCEAHR